METSKEFQNAADGRSLHSESLTFWNSIASGNVGVENAAWIVLIAKRVLEANKARKQARCNGNG